MAPERRNQLVLLAALVVLVAGVLSYQWWQRPSSGAAPASNDRGTTRSVARGMTAPEAPDVHTPRLGDERPKPIAGRNLFRFKPKAPPPLPPAPAPPQQPLPALGPTPTITAPIALRYIGSVDRGAGKAKVAAFVDVTGRPVVCIEGADCDGRYHIWRVGVESVDISYLDGSGRRTIRQGGG